MTQTNAQHTEGPWKAISTSHVDTVARGDNSFIFKGADGSTVAGIQLNVRGNNALKSANARLIASAPELVQALEDTLKALEDYNAGRLNHPTTTPEVIREARALLLKVKP